MFSCTHFYQKCHLRYLSQRLIEFPSIRKHKIVKDSEAIICFLWCIHHKHLKRKRKRLYNKEDPWLKQSQKYSPNVLAFIYQKLTANCKDALKSFGMYRYSKDEMIRDRNANYKGKLLGFRIKEEKRQEMESECF